MFWLIVEIEDAFERLVQFQCGGECFPGLAYQTFDRPCFPFCD